MGLSRQDAIPPAGPEIWIYRLKAGEKATLIVYGSKVWGVWTHWNGKSSEPCFTPHDLCTGHKRELPAKWKGYLHGFLYEKQQEVFMEFTPTAAKVLKGEVDLGLPLRGSRITMQRTSAQNGRLKVSALAPAPDILKITPEKEPWETLCKLWGISDYFEKFGVTIDAEPLTA
jgi:hypothetical protein